MRARAVRAFTRAATQAHRLRSGLLVLLCLSSAGFVFFYVDVHISEFPPVSSASNLRNFQNVKEDLPLEHLCHGPFVLTILFYDEVPLLASLVEKLQSLIPKVPYSCIWAYTTNAAAAKNAMSLFRVENTRTIEIILLQFDEEERMLAEADSIVRLSLTVRALMRHFLSHTFGLQLMYWEVDLDPSPDSMDFAFYLSARIKAGDLVGGSLAIWYPHEAHFYGDKPVNRGVVFSQMYVDTFAQVLAQNSVQARPRPQWKLYERVQTHWYGAEHCLCEKQNGWSSPGMIASPGLVREWAYNVIAARPAPMRDWDKQVASYMRETTSPVSRQPNRFPGFPTRKQTSPWAWPCLSRVKHNLRKSSGATVVKGSLHERVLGAVPAQGDPGFLINFNASRLSSSDCLDAGSFKEDTPLKGTQKK